MRTTGLFLYTAGIILALTGVAKIWSALSHVRVLDQSDPILGWPFRYVLIAAAVLELAASAFCFFDKSKKNAAMVVAWLATSFLAYRLGLQWIDWERPCPCLGHLTEALNIPTATADMTMKILLGYLLLGSYASLLWLRLRGGKGPVKPLAPAAATASQEKIDAETASQ